MHDVQPCLINALAGILPLEAKINIFGFWHSIILVGCFYRHDNLCWLLLNRLNHRLYITPHFLADALHLFKRVRSSMQLIDKQKNKIWTRQGVNDAMCIFPTANAFQGHQAVKLNTLPSAVLSFTHTQSAMAEVVAFLKGVGKAGTTLQKFTRLHAAPGGFSPLTSTFTDSTCGWKVCKTARSCQNRSKQECPCAPIVQGLLAHGFSTLAPTDAAAKLIQSVPSSVDKPTCSDLYAHYDSFITYVRSNPTVLFFPQGDHKIT
jgi:hypothetical protein